MACTILENVSLAPYCSMKVGGNAKRVMLPKSIDEVISAVRECRESNEKYIVVGNCSNLIFPDSGYDGTVIITSNVRGLELEGNVITAACGETLSSLARFACESSLTGLEFCYGIPGTVGGAVFMNAGAYGGEISQRFVSCTVLGADGRVYSAKNVSMAFGYRKSVLSDENIILLSASFECESGDAALIRERMDALMAKRKSSQPLEYPSCGSAFKRPVGHYAGALIEQCGLKGYSIGGARVSEKHAGFIINGGNATATDVIALMKYVADTVFEKTGVRLEPEIRVIE